MGISALSFKAASKILVIPKPYIEHCHIYAQFDLGLCYKADVFKEKKLNFDAKGIDLVEVSQLTITFNSTAG